jgi:hypothetical protein
MYLEVKKVEEKVFFGMWKDKPVLLGELYILNSPVLTNWGVFEYSPTDLGTVKYLLQNYSFESAIGHEATAKFLSQLTGVEIPVNRIAVKMKQNDLAIVFRVLQRLPEGKILTETELQNYQFELGLLKYYGKFYF